MSNEFRSFFPTRRASWIASLAVAALIAAPALLAQDTAPTPPQTDSTPAQTSAPAQTPAADQTSAPPATAPGATASATMSNTPPTKKQHVAKTDRVKQTKDTKAENKRETKYNPLIGKDAQLPDKTLYDKALAEQKKGHFDVARLDLQTLLNTYPDSQYQMRAKLAVADSWYHEGGTAALAQAEQEYKDFITFFPNAPEAAEAQMRVGDIYFKQMDVPDRDYAKAQHAEEEYRTMLRQYPDAPPAILAEARQKLREVQEVLATREADLGTFYASHENWPATIARYKTVVDTYPQYSHMDDVLIGEGDAYEAEANIIRKQNLPEGARAKLEQEYDGKAAEAYRAVVLDHAAAPHAEDAKERLAGMNLPIPTPTPAEVAASEELEGSRAQYTMRKRMELLFLRKPDTVTAARTGAPPLDDAAPTVAPTVVRGLQADYVAALNPGSAAAPASPKPATDADATPATPTVPEPSAAAASAAPALSDVPAAGQGAVSGDTSSVSEATPSTSSRPAVGGSGAALGVEVLTPGATTGTGASNIPAATGAADPNNGLSAVGSKGTAALPPVEKPADAPDQVNEAQGKSQPPADTKAAGQKKDPKPAYDKDDESSSTHKKKKGLDKLNPF
jgi:outer membrane protein assembly factor BamD